jgi:hypothetical protein
VELRVNVLRDEGGRGEHEEAAPVMSCFEGGWQQPDGEDRATSACA